MDKKYHIKKGKDIFLYDIKSNRYYDLQRNSNIIGHSNKKLTTIVKNNISSRWNITGDTIYHRRLRSLFNRIFSANYFLTSSFCLIEIILRLHNYSINNSYNLYINGDRFNLWFNEKFNNIKTKIKNEFKNIIIYDMAEIFLSSNGDFNRFEEDVGKLKKGDITVYNYYWYPYPDIITNSADLIILPEIYSGNFNYLNILINKSIINEQKLFSNELEDIPSLYISSSLKMYHIIKGFQKNNYINLKWDNIIQAGRIFTSDNLNEYKNITERYLEKNIILSKDPPYYNYLPIDLEEYQIKYLRAVKIPF